MSNSTTCMETRVKGDPGVQKRYCMSDLMAKVKEQQVVPLMGLAPKLTWFCAAACLAVLSSTVSVLVLVEGAPILGPDLNNCRPVIPPMRTEAEAEECCFIDTGKPIKKFVYDSNLPMRVRRPIHKLDEEFVRKYERAYELMRALPPEDPRSFAAQSKFHCAYCTGSYSQFNSSESLDVHGSWLTMPFHRWYVYFHERILASLIGDDTFAIPYWAWDIQYDPTANVLPSIFMNPSSPLFDPLRSYIHRPPNRADLEIQHPMKPYNKDPEVMKRNNYYNMWRVMVGETKTPATFFGGKFSAGDAVEHRGGLFEMGPHVAIHSWTGSDSTPFQEDMGPSYSSARDPLFFAHHSQVDRLWMMWNSLGRKDWDEPDWLDAEFLFYDELGDMVRVNIRDSLDVEKLRISYEMVPVDWLDYTPTSIRNTDPNYARIGTLGQIWRQVISGDVMRNISKKLRCIFQVEKSRTDVVLGRGRAVVTTQVCRPGLSLHRMMTENISSKNISPMYDEVLVVRGLVRKSFDIGVQYKLFMELPEANENTPVDCVEYLGSWYIEPQGLPIGGETSVAKGFTQMIGIGDRIPILGIGRKNSVTITFVPAWNPQHDSVVSIIFTELRIDLQSTR